MTDQAFADRFQIKLNPQQEAAVRQVEGPVLLLAVPGSGKTTVLVTRLGYMLYCKGIQPENILTVTYTVAATRDMRQRYAAIFGEEYAGRLTFRTINSLCALVIQHYARKNRSVPFGLADKEGALNAAVRELLVKTGSDYPSDLQVKDARTHITYCKNMMLTNAEIQNHKVDGMDFPAVFAGYQAYLRDHQRMDFDDQMVFTYRIFRQHPEVLHAFQQRYRYLCVDEAQDTSKIQHAILRLLAAERRNLFMVGDEDQSIYGFRAAWPQALLAFETTYPGAKVLLMETNYRSTGEIVAHADALIRRNRDRRPKHMRTENPAGRPIRRVVLADYNRQYRYLLQVAEDCQRSTAILFRNNDSALPLVDLLERKGVPYFYRQREGFFFSSPLVRDVTDMLRFAFNDCDRDLFLRFYYKLDLKVKKALLAKLLRYQKREETVFETLLGGTGLEPWQLGKVKALQTHFSQLPQMESFAAIQRIVRSMGYGDYLREQRADTAKLDILRSLANQNPELGPFLLRLEELKGKLKETRPECPFVLSTIHASKGLEYDRVILIDVMDGIFPAGSASDRETRSEEDRSALEEERRLFYVGVTRAREQLELLTYARKFGEDAGGSAFLSELLGEERAAPEPPERTPTRQEVAAWEKDYIPGTEVVHKTFGSGVLQSKAGGIAVIYFTSCGVKKVDLTACLKKGLLWRGGL